MSRQIPIVADTRETRSGILDRLRADDRFAVEVRPLEVGDYWIDGDLAVERKGLTDFYRSIFDGKVFRQASELRWAAPRSLMLVEGLPRSPAFAKLQPWLVGALLTITAGFQVPIVPTKNPDHTAETLYLLAKHQTRRSMGTPHFPYRGRAPSVDRWLRHRVLQAVPRVGPKRATALLNAFETLGPIFAATPEALTEVEGIGDEIAALLARLGCGALES